MTGTKSQRQDRLSREIPDSVVHGRNCYVNWGCHCDICRAGHNEYMKNYRKAKKEQRK